jgi:hypothetical protein
MTSNSLLLNFWFSKLLIWSYIDMRNLVNRKMILKNIHNCCLSLWPHGPTTACSWCITVSLGGQLYQQSLGDWLPVSCGFVLAWIFCNNSLILSVHILACFREVYTVWYGRVGATSYIPSEKVQQLFNDMQLYPSKSQGNGFCVCVFGSYDGRQIGALSLCVTWMFSPCLEYYHTD